MSSEMDFAEIRFIRKPFIKERCAEVSRKIRPSPTCEGPMKIPRHLVQLLAVGRILIANGAHSPILSVLCLNSCFLMIPPPSYNTDKLISPECFHLTSSMRKLDITVAHKRSR